MRLGLWFLTVFLISPLARGQEHHGGKHGGHGRRFKDAEQWAKEFESAERERWQRPAAVIAALKLRGDERALDLGSGTGYFAVRLARALPRGRVIGSDIEEGMTRFLERRAKRESLANLTAVTGKPDDPRLAENVDLVFICNTYHHLPDRTAYFRRLAGRLRGGARIAIVDFKGGKLPVGPPERERVLPAQLERELAAAGYGRVSLDERLLPHQYLAIFRLLPPSLPPHRDRACASDAECALYEGSPCSCPICSSRFREPISKRALETLRREWARRKCQTPACAECRVDGEWLGTRALCRRGQCVVE